MHLFGVVVDRVSVADRAGAGRGIVPSPDGNAANGAVDGAADLVVLHGAGDGDHRVAGR